EQALASLPESATGSDLKERVLRTATQLEALDARLAGAPGIAMLLHAKQVLDRIDGDAGALVTRVDRIEAALDAGPRVAPAEQEALNQALVRLRDALWSVRH